MDVPPSRKCIHNTRWFFATNPNRLSEYDVPRKVWANWTNKVKAYANMCDGSSYAQVLKNSLPWTYQSESRNVSIAKTLGKYSTIWAINKSQNTPIGTRNLRSGGIQITVLSKTDNSY